MLLYVSDMFHILLSGDSLRDLWNASIYVCMYDKNSVEDLFNEYYLILLCSVQYLVSAIIFGFSLPSTDETS
jgi:hypothetical protein